MSLLETVEAVEELAETCCGSQSEQVGNTEEREWLPLDAVTVGPVKTQLAEKTKCAVVDCVVCETLIVLDLIVVTSCMFTNSNLICSYSYLVSVGVK
jgi:hypothetical protein